MMVRMLHRRYFSRDLNALHMLTADKCLLMCSFLTVKQQPGTVLYRICVVRKIRS